MRKSAVFGLLSGLAVVVATLIMVGVVNLPKAEGAFTAGLHGAAACRNVPVALDQGYELTRKVVREVCGSAD